MRVIQEIIEREKNKSCKVCGHVDWSPNADSVICITCDNPWDLGMKKWG